MTFFSFSKKENYFVWITENSWVLQKYFKWWYAWQNRKWLFITASGFVIYFAVSSRPCRDSIKERYEHLRKPARHSTLQAVSEMDHDLLSLVSHWHNAAILRKLHLAFKEMIITNFKTGMITPTCLSHHSHSPVSFYHTQTYIMNIIKYFY